MGAKPLFGSKIETSCDYCQNSARTEEGLVVCTIKKSIKNGRCKKFFYDPFSRVPKGANTTPLQFDKSEFSV